MTEAEINQIQVMTHNVLVPTGEELLLALALCGASASEIAVVCTQDIDIDARVIQLWGESERTNPIDDWSLGVMDEAVMRIPDSTPMVVRPDLPIQRAAHTVTVRTAAGEERIEGDAFIIATGSRPPGFWSVPTRN